MRLAILIAVLLASTARASDWEGTWTVDGGGERTLAREGSLLVLDAALEVRGERQTFHLVGAPNGHRLHLQGSSTETPGFVGALDGRHGGGKHRATVEAQLDDGVAEARFTIDGEARSETWRRGGLEIVTLLSDGKPLAGAFDAKRSSTGLVFKYRVSGCSSKITARILVGPGHPFASFYSSSELHSHDLGTVEPGEHEASWDGRDATAAKRIALGGPYRLVLESGPIHAEKTFTVNPPRFEAIGSAWPDWSPREHLDRLAGLVVPGTLSRSPGFDFEGARIATSADDVKKRAREAGTLLLSTHGNRGTLAVHDGTISRSYEPSHVFGADLKDCHFAFASACLSANGENGSSVVEQLVSAGCDVAIGYEKSVEIAEADDFETASLALLAIGAPIEKASRDAARAVSELPHGLLPAGAAKIEKCLVAKRAAGIDESETLWPPRYGCSTN